MSERAQLARSPSCKAAKARIVAFRTAWVPVQHLHCSKAVSEVTRALANVADASWLEIAGIVEILDTTKASRLETTPKKNGVIRTEITRKWGFERKHELEITKKLEPIKAKWLDATSKISS